MVYGTTPSSWWKTSRESGWNKEAAAVCNDAAGLARSRSRTHEKDEKKKMCFSVGQFGR